jgi:glycerophosphoryl diester phosphodiesterase
VVAARVSSLRLSFAGAVGRSDRVLEPRAVGRGIYAGALGVIVAFGCSSATEQSIAPAPAANAPPAAGGATNAPTAPTATPPSDAGAEASDGASYKSSLGSCWTDAKCPRVMAVAHGGDWDQKTPYGSMAAIASAYKRGVEAVKIDVRVTKDDVPVVAHSSPIEIYESIDCYDKKIEEMTAAEVTGCHFATSTKETFKTLDDVLGYAKGKMVLQLTVKESKDYARAIDRVLGASAADYAFFEVSTEQLSGLLPTLPGNDKVFYLVNVEDDYAKVDLLLDTIKNPRAFMVEMNPSTEVPAIVSSKLHPAGLRAFTYDKSNGASVEQLKQHYESGFDVVSANASPNVVKARIAVNQANGVAPP